MRSFIIISFLGCLFVFTSNHLSSAQSVAEGRVVDAETGKPLEGAHVYFSGTRIGTATGAAGRYELQKIPAGGYRIVASMIGYGTQIKSLVIGPNERIVIRFKLKPAVYNMPEIYVGDLVKGWKKNLKRFKRNFIGQTARADSVKILNPEVLRFDKKWWGKFTAEALAPLKIENRALGYYITYHLKEFEHTGLRTRWDGEPHFTEMKPADSSQAAYWKKNRKLVFYGSLRHFLLALKDNRVKEEGFVLYKLRRGLYGNISNNRFRTSARTLVHRGEKGYLHRINFFGRLEIVYTREPEERGFVQWLRNNRRGPARMQTSWLELNERPVTFDEDGEFVQPYGATQFGYFAYTMIADATPRGYRPDGWRVQSKSRQK